MSPLSPRCNPSSARTGLYLAQISLVRVYLVQQVGYTLTPHAAVSKDMAVWYTKQANKFHPDPNTPIWRENILRILANME